MRLRIAAEGALRENIFDNEEPSGGARRLARRGATAGGIQSMSRVTITLSLLTMQNTTVQLSHFSDLNEE